MDLSANLEARLAVLGDINRNLEAEVRMLYHGTPEQKALERAGQMLYKVHETGGRIECYGVGTWMKYLDVVFPRMEILGLPVVKMSFKDIHTEAPRKLKSKDAALIFCPPNHGQEDIVPLLNHIHQDVPIVLISTFREISKDVWDNPLGQSNKNNACLPLHYGTHSRPDLASPDPSIADSQALNEEHAATIGHILADETSLWLTGAKEERPPLSRQELFEQADSALEFWALKEDAGYNDD